jgi:nitroimidazol reductase NimA-like FMN-containing flavoprotein (pyridoxamine 5'-phosphate oxidase superfamily)
MSQDYARTARTTLKRRPQRGRYDRKTVHAILDSAVVCHIGYAVDGQPFVTPTAYWREGDAIYWHGSAASRMLRVQEAGAEICVTVTVLDGLVLARSAFHHSLNFRSLMMFGRAHKVESAADKEARMAAFLERMYPGRWEELQRLRPVRRKELNAITVLGLHLHEVSAKVRSGPPVDDEEDYALPLWAGVIPVNGVNGAPIHDARLAAGAALPTYLTDLSHLGLAPQGKRPVRRSIGK